MRHWRHTRSSSLIFFSAIPSLSTALSLNSFQGFTNYESSPPSSACLGAYGMTIPTCELEDFKSGCSEGCQSALNNVAALVTKQCNGVPAPEKSLLALVRGGQVVSALCPASTTTTTTTVQQQPTSSTTSQESVTIPTTSPGVIVPSSSIDTSSTDTSSTATSSTATSSTDFSSSTDTSTTDSSTTNTSSTDTSTTDSSSSIGSSSTSDTSPTEISTSMSASFTNSEISTTTTRESSTTNESSKTSSTQPAKTNTASGGNDSGGGSPFDINANNNKNLGSSLQIPAWNLCIAILGAGYLVGR